MDKIADTLLQAVKEAGAAIFAMQKTGFTVAKKANQDIVTQADLVANDILKKALIGQFPHYGWLSEESIDDQTRFERERVWVVDPIDGTKEYASGLPEYAVSVALVEKGKPIVAAVFNPATDELFYAIKNQGAWLNDKKIECRYSTSDKLILLASRSEYARGEWQQFEKTYEVKQVGSIAYKLGLIAAGKADATFSLGPKSEWDIAAGDLLVSEAGGYASNRLKKALSFNQANVLVDGIVATSKVASDKIFVLISSN